MTIFFSVIEFLIPITYFALRGTLFNKPNLAYLTTSQPTLHNSLLSLRSPESEATIQVLSLCFIHPLVYRTLTLLVASPGINRACLRRGLTICLVLPTILPDLRSPCSPLHRHSALFFSRFVPSPHSGASWAGALPPVPIPRWRRWAQYVTARNNEIRK